MAKVGSRIWSTQLLKTFKCSTTFRSILSLIGQWCRKCSWITLTFWSSGLAGTYLLLSNCLVFKQILLISGCGRQIGLLFVWSSEFFLRILFFDFVLWRLKLNQGFCASCCSDSRMTDDRFETWILRLFKTVIRPNILVAIANNWRVRIFVLEGAHLDHLQKMFLFAIIKKSCA